MELLDIPNHVFPINIKSKFLNMSVSTLSIIHFIFCGVTALVIDFIMGIILERNGISDKSFFIWIGTISEFWSLLKKETDLKLKRKYKFLFWLQIAIIPFYIIGGILILTL